MYVHLYVYLDHECLLMDKSVGERQGSLGLLVEELIKSKVQRWGESINITLQRFHSMPRPAFIPLPFLLAYLVHRHHVSSVRARAKIVCLIYCEEMVIKTNAVERINKASWGCPSFFLITTTTCKSLSLEHPHCALPSLHYTHHV